MLEVPLSGIKKIEEVAGSSSEYISLSQGSIKVGGIPQQIKTYIQELLNGDKTDYYESCWGLRVLRDRLARMVFEEFSSPIEVKQIIPTHGCIGGLSLIYLTLLQPGDEVIIPEPAYPAYGLLTHVTRSKAVYVSCVEASSNDIGGLSYHLDIDKIKAAVTDKTKIIIFSNPSNPFGIIISPSVIRELLAWCEQRGIYLVIDEAYRSYVFEGSFESSLSMMHQSEFLISANTFSKNFAMSGWRIGYLVVPQKLANALAGMQDALLNCLNNTAQYAALYALDHPEFSHDFHAKVLRNRDMAMHMIQPLVDKGVVSYAKPQGGFFLLLKTNMSDATDLCMSLLNQAKVGVIPGSSFGPSGKPFLRVCYAREPEVLTEGIRRLVNYLG